MADFQPKLKEKNWRPNFEEEIIKMWQEQKTYAFNKKTTKPIFCIDTPPPYCSGSWHIGGAIHYSQIDMIARVKRMEGFEVRFPMATDRNGLPIEVQVEKAYSINMFDVPREKFLSLCKEFLDKYEREILDLAIRLGLSCNSFDESEIIRTDSPEYRRITQATFIELWNKGLIYVDTRANNWCPGCHTTISDAEVEYREEETNLVYIKFKVKETNEDLIIATTRPELLCACRAVIVHPDDDRYKHLHHKTAIVPLYNIEVKIIPHKEAKMDFGTGAVMICSYGDYTDVRLFRDLNLEPVVSITPEGKMTDCAGELAGLPVKEAREKIIHVLQENNLLLKIERIIHRQPICWRSKDPIEFIAMDEYYLKQVDFIEDLKRVADQITFFPKESKQILLDWLNSVSKDWPISRRRYYGTEIPIWYCKSCGKPVVPPPGPYYQPWKQDPPFDKCPHCGSTEGFKGEWRTFDTWMDSSISSLQAIWYMRDEEIFKKAFPCSLRPQGKDIVRTWLYYTLLRVYQLLKKPAFKYVWISGMVVDEKGEAMHKSKGNIVWPKPLIEKYGSDALRLFGVLEASHGSDLRYSEERLSAAYKFLTKLWNIARFISMFPVVDSDYVLTTSDEWILSELNKVIKESLDGYKQLNFHIPGVTVRNFVWNIFASHYIELIKSRAYNRENKFTEQEQRGAWYTLHTVLKKVLLLLAPITPMITEKIYLTLYNPNESIHHQQLPNVDQNIPNRSNLTQVLLTVNTLIWKTKKENNLSLKASIAEAWLPEVLQSIEKDLQAMHNILNISFRKPPSEGSLIKQLSNNIVIYIKLR
ncbi:MAG: valine--tRNA ligase [Candidatus Asgardarchaeia archaeon]